MLLIICLFWTDYYFMLIRKYGYLHFFQQKYSGNYKKNKKYSWELKATSCSYVKISETIPQVTIHNIPVMYCYLTPKIGHFMNPVHSTSVFYVVVIYPYFCQGLPAFVQKWGLLHTISESERKAHPAKQNLQLAPETQIPPRSPPETLKPVLNNGGEMILHWAPHGAGVPSVLLPIQQP